MHVFDWRLLASFRRAWAESLAPQKAEPLVLERKRAASKALSESQLDRVKELSAILAEKATTAVVKQCVDLDEYDNVDKGCGIGS